MRLVVSLFLLLSLSACVPEAIIRHSPRYKANESFYSKNSIEDLPSGAKIAYIELDDMGDLWEAAELNSAVEAIANANQAAAGAIVVTYVHGWAQNADPKKATKAKEKSNLTMFKRVMGWIAYDEIVDADSTGRARRPVVGVFLSWRGTNGHWPADYYNRNSTAAQVAGSTATEALLRITGTARRNAQTRSILIGHSMGGLIVERSLIPAIDAYLLRLADKSISSQCDVKSAREGIPADLIVLINPASHAIEAQKFIGTLQRLRAQFRPPSQDCPFFSDNTPWNLPLLVSLTSEGDWATRIVLNLAAYPMAAPKAFRDYTTIDLGGGKLLSQRDLSLHTAGNFEPLASHWVRHLSLDRTDGEECSKKAATTSVKPSVQECTDTDWSKDSSHHRPEDQIAPFPSSKSLKSLCFESKDVCGNDRFWIVQKNHTFNSLEIGGGVEPTPYWIMHIPTSIVEEHSKIFTLPLMRFLRGLMELTGATGVVPAKCDPPQPKGRCFDLNPNSVQPSTRTPVTCAQPPALLLDYEGLLSGCSLENAIPCLSGEPFNFRLLRQDTLGIYDANEDCEAIQWDFADGTPPRFSNPVVHTFPTDLGQALVEIKSPVVNRIFTFPKISVVDRIEPAVSYRGARSNCSEQGGSCWRGELIRLSILKPDDAHTIWLIDDEKKEGSSVEHRFAAAGTHRIHVSVSKDGKGGDTYQEIEVNSHCSGPIDEVAVQFNGIISGCSPGSKKDCILEESIAFSLSNLPEDSEEGCFSVIWNYGDSSPDGEGLTSSHTYNAKPLTDAVNVSATVTSTGRTIAATIPLNLACPPPKSVLLDYLGEDSGCTRGTSGSEGPLCKLGETITFSLSQSSEVKNCDKVQWSFSPLNERQVKHAFLSPVPSVSVTISSGGQEVSDIAPISFIPGSNCPQLHEISISYAGDRGCNQHSRCSPGERIEFSAVSPVEIGTECSGMTFRWLFDDGTAQEGATASKSFGRSKPPHAVHLIVSRNGELATHTATVTIPLLKCRAQPCAGG